MLYAGSALLTVLEDPVDIKAVGSASFVVGAALEFGGQLAGPAVVYNAGIRVTYCVCKENIND